MNRVTVTRSMVGICHMQVCAKSDATDEEILAVCNKENISGTRNGWALVIRDNYESNFWPADKMKPVPCQDDPTRTHFMVGC